MLPAGARVVESCVSIHSTGLQTIGTHLGLRLHSPVPATPPVAHACTAAARLPRSRKPMATCVVPGLSSSARMGALLKEWKAVAV